MATLIRSGRGTAQQSDASKRKIKHCRDPHKLVDAVNNNRDTVELSTGLCNLETHRGGMKAKRKF